MNWIARTLWDLLALDRGLAPGPARPPGRPAAGAPIRPPARPPVRRPMQDRYDALVTEMKRDYRVRVRKWRTSSCGCAWRIVYEDGKVSRLIEAPYPRGPMSCAVFLHEIGHHAIGFGTYKPRCLEEYHAWRWALDTMRARGLNVTPAVEKRARESLAWAVQKARRRGLRRVPAELVAYLDCEQASG